MLLLQEVEGLHLLLFLLPSPSSLLLLREGNTSAISSSSLLTLRLPMFIPVHRLSPIPPLSLGFSAQEFTPSRTLVSKGLPNPTTCLHPFHSTFRTSLLLPFSPISVWTTLPVLLSFITRSSNPISSICLYFPSFCHYQSFSFFPLLNLFLTPHSSTPFNPL